MKKPALEGGLDQIKRTFTFFFQHLVMHATRFKMHNRALRKTEHTIMMQRDATTFKQQSNPLRRLVCDTRRDLIVCTSKTLAFL